MSTRTRKPSACRLKAEAADPSVFAKPSWGTMPQRNTQPTLEEAPPKKRSRVTIQDKDNEDTDVLGDVPPLQDVSDSEDEGDDDAQPINVDLVEKCKSFTM
jgi:hypothetical protein